MSLFVKNRKNPRMNFMKMSKLFLRLKVNQMKRIQLQKFGMR